MLRHCRCDVDLATYFDEQHEAYDPETPGRRLIQQPVAHGRHSCILKVAASPRCDHDSTCSLAGLTPQLHDIISVLV